MSVQPAEPGEAPIEELPRRRRFRWWWLIPGVVLLAGTGFVVWSLTGGEPVEATEETTGPVATTDVVRETITDTRSFDGALGHGEPSTVTAAAQGVVTRIAESGTAVKRGTELYRVDEQPVTVMYGDIPMYRDLERGDSGVDVEQLIDNLTAMGYADCEAVDKITWCVEVAVEDWQEELGVEETGVVAQADVVFLPTGYQIDSVHIEPGDVTSPGMPVVDLAGADQVASLEVDVRDRDLLSVGTEVAVQLPGGVEVDGTVTFSQVVPNPEAADAGVDDTITKVEVTLSEPVDEALLGAPADVMIDIGERVDVLTVPVNALLALSEGGHGLEVVADDGTLSIIPVETGLFAQGRVEVSGDGIEEGTVVGVAGR